MSAVRVALFAIGYPTAILVIVRWVPVVRDRRLRWVGVHHLGVACIVAGWAIDAAWTAVIVNSAWLASATIWYVTGGRGPCLREGNRSP